MHVSHGLVEDSRSSTHGFATSASSQYQVWFTVNTPSGILKLTRVSISLCPSPGSPLM